MKRLAIGVLLVAAMGGVWLSTAIARDAEYRRLVAAGDQALAEDQIFPALEAFSGAIALKDDAMLAYVKRGETYRRRGDLDAALRDLAEASALAPQATRPLEQLGDAAQALGRYEDAATHYAAYVALDDRSPRVQYKLALAHHYGGRTSRSIPRLRRLVESEPEMSEAHYLLGIALWAQDRPDAAIDALSRAVALSPGFIPARDALRGVFAATARTDREVEQLEALAALEPDRPERDVDLALGYARAGRTDMAVLALGRTAEEHPEQPAVYAALGRVWLDIARTTDDRVALSKSLGALQSIPVAAASSDALTLLARALLLAGQFAEAVAALELATTRFPVAPTAYLELADLREHEGDDEQARRLLVTHDALTAHAAPALRVARLTRIAELSLALADPADAARRLEVARALGTPAPPLLWRLADAYGRAGDPAAARAVVADGLGLYPDEPTLVSLERRFSGS